MKAYKIMMRSEEYIDLFSRIGERWDSDGLILEVLQKFVCEPYGKSNLTTVNEARYEIFRMSFKTDTSLPPNMDALVLHTKRANYQAGIHRRCLQTVVDAPSPHGHG